MKKSFFTDSLHVYVIAEAGSNWKCGNYDEDLKQAKKLIDIASNAGADAVKFQTYKPETIYVPNAGESLYKNGEKQFRDINEMFEFLSMPYEMIPELADYCNKAKIEFMSTPFSINDAKQIDPYVDVHKVASFEINHVRLLEFLSKTHKPLILSTGASTFTEIDFAVNLIKKFGNEKTVLLQCTSKYPCAVESLNLKVIPELKDRYKVIVGLSDHSTDPVIGPLVAIGLGARVIEKHFTIDKNLPGPDHSFALNPDELELMIKSIRSAELALGTGEKKILEEEKELRKIATRSIQAIKKISKGDVLEEGINFDILRPGNRIRGLDARHLVEINNKKSVKDIEIGDGILEFK